MVNETSSSGSSNTNSSGLDLDDPLCLHPNDISNLTIISFKLEGTSNNQSWATATTRALTIRNKLVFVNGNFEKPTDNVKSVKWDRINAVVVSWLLASMSESISGAFVLSENAKDLWNELKQTFEKINGSVIFNTFQKINLHSQGVESVSNYYTSLNGLWKEFDSLSHLGECTCANAKDRKTFADQLKLMQFLMGLNESFSQIRRNLLMQEPLPTVQTAFSIISREESHKGSVSDNSSKSQPSVFASKGPDFKKRARNPNLICKHCNLKDHTIDRFYKLIGFPKDFKTRNDTVFQNKSSANISKSEGVHSPTSESKAPNQLSSDQVVKLLSLLKENTMSGDASANMAGSLGRVNMVSSNKFFEFPRKWIVDSGATQHMTWIDDFLEDSVDVSDLKMHVDHPNGSKAFISKIGNLKITSNVSLVDVLVVPEFSVHLLSVHKIARDSRLGVFFDENSVYLCNLQDLQTNPIV